MGEQGPPKPRPPPEIQGEAPARARGLRDPRRPPLPPQWHGSCGAGWANGVKAAETPPLLPEPHPGVPPPEIPEPFPLTQQPADMSARTGRTRVHRGMAPTCPSTDTRSSSQTTRETQRMQPTTQNVRTLICELAVHVQQAHSCRHRHSQLPHSSTKVCTHPHGHKDVLTRLHSHAGHLLRHTCTHTYLSMQHRLMGAHT